MGIFFLSNGDKVVDGFSVGGFPDLLEEGAGVKLGAITGQAKLDGKVVCIHNLPHHQLFPVKLWLSEVLCGEVVKSAKNERWQKV